MKKKSIELSARDLRARLKEKPIRRARQPKDSEIDFSDIPELTAEQLNSARRVGRPLIGSEPRQAVHIRLDRDVLRKIKEQARKRGVRYQSLINELLKKAV